MIGGAIAFDGQHVAVTDIRVADSQIDAKPCGPDLIVRLVAKLPDGVCHGFLKLGVRILPGRLCRFEDAGFTKMQEPLKHAGAG